MNPDTYRILLHLHSVGRWIVLLLLVIAIFNSLVAGKRPWIRTDARTGTILVIFADLMLLVGLAQWYWGPKGYNFIRDSGFSAVMKDSFQRFFAIEHITGMVIAIILVHIGKTQARKKISDKAKHRRTLIYYLIALIIILAVIPWPFRHIGQQAGSGWY
jgi:L-asparagine transporter-like permease